MGTYEEAVRRQPAKQFSDPQERREVRAVVEHISGKLRYSDERRRRWGGIKVWVGILVPTLVVVWKALETFFWHGG